MSVFYATNPYRTVGIVAYDSQPLAGDTIQSMDNKQLLQQLVEIFSSGDVSHVDELFTVDYVDHQKPEWIEYDGPREFKQIVALARQSLTNLHVTIEGTLVTEGDMIAGRLRWAGDNVERETLEILGIESGKVAEHWGAEAWIRPKESASLR